MSTETAARPRPLRLTQARIGDTLHDGNGIRVTIVNAFTTVKPGGRRCWASAGRAAIESGQSWKENLEMAVGPFLHRPELLEGCLTSENESRLLANPSKYLAGAYDTFLAFGGPSVYFHVECLRACQEQFLSERHLEMLYATLTAWGMHRMGDTEKTKTKLTEWRTFCDCIQHQRNKLERFTGCDMRTMSVPEYSAVLNELMAVYEELHLSVAAATIVVNSKALFHLLPELIPPIDRQYTMRFYVQPPSKWLGKDGGFRPIQTPVNAGDQFRRFADICLLIKRLADRSELSGYLTSERSEHDVPAPKAIDNAIVNYVRMTRGELREQRRQFR